MKEVKIVFFDVDGTLVDMNKKKITPRTIETLQKLQAKGVKIAIATGRPLSIIPKFPDVDFDVFLTFNASYCCTNQDVIFKNPIPTDAVKQIINNATKIHRPVTIASADRLGSNGSDQNLVDYFAISNQDINIVEDFDALMEEDVYQMMIGCVKEEYATILQNVHGAEITAWWDRAVDVIPANGGKGLGVEKVLEYYGYSKAEAIAFGDGTNDIEMLKAVGTGVAMGNATNNVKEIADAVCLSVSEDGIYHYCVENGLTEA